MPEKVDRCGHVIIIGIGRGHIIFEWLYFCAVMYHNFGYKHLGIIYSSIFNYVPMHIDNILLGTYT